jgi:uncharacterized protein YaaW (UPF0174 family)
MRVNLITVWCRIKKGGSQMARIATCIKPVVTKLSVEERAFLHLFLDEGKEAQSIVRGLRRAKDPSAFKKEWGAKRSTTEIAESMNDAFTSGLGIADVFADIDDNYGCQLQYTIDEVICKHLDAEEPEFRTGCDSLNGAIDREKWITEQLFNRWWRKQPKHVREAITKDVITSLKNNGIDPAEATRVGAALVMGGLTAVKAVVGIQFNFVFIAIVNATIGAMVKAITGKGLSLAANAALAKFIPAFFGPIGWIISGILLIPTITELFNPREYDKYIPAVFIIGIKRLQMKPTRQRSKN